MYHHNDAVISPRPQHLAWDGLVLPVDHPFWRTKFVLEDPSDLRQIQTCGIKELWIDVQKGCDVEVAGSTKQETEAQIDAALVQIAAPKAPPPRVPMAAEVARAKKICVNAKSAVVSMFQEVRMGKAIDHEVEGPHVTIGADLARKYRESALVVNGIEFFQV